MKMTGTGNRLNGKVAIVASTYVTGSSFYVDAGWMAR